MAKEGMTLYEARRNQGGTVGGPSLSSPPPLRLPVGIGIVAIFVLGAIAVGSYLIGFNRGQSDGERGARDAAAAPSQTIDPLKPIGSGAALTPPIVAKPSAGTDAAVLPGDSALGAPPMGDPRQVGLNYFIVAGELPADRADEMVAFCRGKGLDAVALPSHNARSQVIVLPGFGRDERGAAPVKALEAKIRAVGAQWKAVGRGNGDFHDYYPKLFKGQP